MRWIFVVVAAALRGKQGHWAAVGSDHGTTQRVQLNLCIRNCAGGSKRALRHVFLRSGREKDMSRPVTNRPFCWPLDRAEFSWLGIGVISANGALLSYWRHAGQCHCTVNPLTMRNLFSGDAGFYAL